MPSSLIHIVTNGRISRSWEFRALFHKESDWAQIPRTLFLSLDSLIQVAETDCALGGFIGRKWCSPQHQWEGQLWHQAPGRPQGQFVRMPSHRVWLHIQSSEGNRCPHLDKGSLTWSTCYKVASWLLCPCLRKQFYFPELRARSCCCRQWEHSSEKVASSSSWGYFFVPVFIVT